MAVDRRWLVPLTLGLLVFGIDQYSKHWAATVLGPLPHSRSIALGFSWFQLVYSRNTGVAFGLFQGFSPFFTLTAIMITAGAIYAYGRHLPNRQPWVQFGAGLLFGGAIGNIVDRLRHGFVVDFISVGWWPIFNIADSAITVGVTMLAIYLIFIGEEPPVYDDPPQDDRLLSELLSREPE